MSFKHSFKMDLTKLKQVTRDFKKIAKTEVEWGWINGKKYPVSDKNGRGGSYIASVALANEFGQYVQNMKTMTWIYIPARPYTQQSVTSSIPYSGKMAIKVVESMLSTGSYKESLEEIGQGNVDIVKSSIAKQNMKSLHPKTIAMKDNSQQWKDTGTMIENITSKVVYKRSDYKGDN